jgi:formate dehydrogenase subunit beta
MNINHILHIRDNNAVDTLRDFLSDWWMRLELDAMLAPVELPDHGGAVPEVIEHPDELTRVNPFLPVMFTNTAPMVADFIKDHPGGHLAVMLRPCELCALIELQKRNRVQFPQPVTGDDHKSLILIGVDCPGTFSTADYARHVEQSLRDGQGGVDLWVIREMRPFSGADCLPNVRFTRPAWCRCGHRQHWHSLRGISVGNCL